MTALAKAAVLHSSRTEPGTRAPDFAKFLRVFHGSPHEFNRFDMGKVGTGEGAQAYGFGLYFAGRKEVADYYRRTLSEQAGAVDGKPIIVGIKYMDGASRSNSSAVHSRA